MDTLYTQLKNNNFSKPLVSRLLPYSTIVAIYILGTIVINYVDYCSGRKMVVLIGKTHDFYIPPNKICYQSKTYITLKLMQSTIGVFNQPHSTPSLPILYCSLWANVKY